MSHYSHTMIFTGFLALTLTAHAQVTLDSTLGQSGALPGPNYQIEADLGQQHGGNLFHSFQDFNLQSHESATFSGPDNVQNVISRVTGGNPSNIDGTIRSTIPNADMYFLNPSGIMFGPHAKLDVQGGFHASTADYLRLQDGGRFEARTLGNSLLTVAPITAFGFLTDAPAAIKTQDSQLAVTKGKTFSLIGGGLEFQGSMPPAYDVGEEILNAHGSSWLLADSGRLNLASVASSGEVIPTATGLNLIPATKGGPILATHTELGTYLDEGGGSLFICGGRVEMRRSLINRQTVNQTGGVTDIQVTHLTLRDQTTIDVNTSGTGAGGPVNLQVAEDLTLAGRSNIFANSHGTLPQAGNAGNVNIQARQITLSEGSQIGSATYGTGQGGTIHLQIAKTLTATGIGAENYGSGVFASSENEELENAGNAGNVTIQARQINLTNGAQIHSATWGTGQGGTVHLQAETLAVTGIGADGYPSAVGTSSEHEELANAGAAGNLRIEARQVVLTNGGKLTSGTWGTGPGGNLSLQVGDTLTIAGQGFNGKKSSVVANSRGTMENAGPAGLLHIQAKTINILKNGEISTQSENAGGGNIEILSPNFLYLENGQITTSVKGGTGNGGNITINNPAFVILANAKIVAQADEGHGGDILIRANQFIATPPPSSLVSASSKLGIDGKVMISSPDPNLSSKLFLVSTKGLDVTSQLKRPCGGAKSLEEIMNPRFKFYVYPIAGSRQSVEDWGPSPLPRRPASPPVTGKPGTVSKTPTAAGVNQSGYQPVVLMVECPKEETGK